MAQDEKNISIALDPFERAKRVSKALSDAARLARVSSKARQSTATLGPRARRAARIDQIVFYISFGLLAFVPSVASTVYFECVASDQYVAELRFSVTGGDVGKLDEVGAFTGLINASIVQSTQIVVNYIGSRSAVEAISKIVDLRSIYSSRKIDYISRFNADRPIEGLVKYWQGMYSANISLPSGYVVVKVRSFDRNSTVAIARAVVNAGEQLVADMNERMNNDTMRFAQKELETSSTRLLNVRMELEQARDKHGLLNVAASADLLNKLVGETKSVLLSLQEDYSAKVHELDPSTPQMRVLKERINATAGEIQALKNILTDGVQGNDGKSLAAAMSRFSELELEQKIDEKLYEGSLASLEVARAASRQKRIYLTTFVPPAAPETAQYPKRLLSSGISIALSFGVWSLLYKMYSLYRYYYR